MEYQTEKTFSCYPNIISYECNKKIIKQMEKNICKIKMAQEQATGFFCKIPFPDKNNRLPVLITNNHIINKRILNKNDIEIQIDIKEENEIKKINLNNRMNYTNKKFDIAIIEIKEEDNINNYLELDDKIINCLNSDIINEEYEDTTIYIIQYPKGHLSVSYGVIEKIQEDKRYEFIHNCSTEEGSSGSPILNIYNNKIIGIYKDGINEQKHNKGTFLNYPIKEFIKKNYDQQIFQKKDKPHLSSSNGSNILDKENKYKSDIIINLIRFLYFKKELISKNQSSYIFEGYIIKDEIINILMKLYNIKEIIRFLENNGVLKDVTYQNFNSIYSKINGILDDYQNNNINPIEYIVEQDQFSVFENNSFFYSKNVNNNTNLKYFDNFEIIDKEFSSFLSKTFDNRIDLLPNNYIKNENKIILAIIMKQNYIYEIIAPNSNFILTVLYVIEINHFNIFKNLKLFNNHIFKIIREHGIEKLISFGEPTRIDNNLILNIHSINEGTIIINMNKDSHEISFDFDKTIRKLRIYFFNQIKRADLIENKNIEFISEKNIILRQDDSISKYFNKNEKNNMIFIQVKIKFIFQTNDRKEIKLFIEDDKSIKELIIKFFEKINMLTGNSLSIGDKDIEFINNDKIVPTNSDELIKNFFNYENQKSKIKIIVDDKKGKINLY